MFATQKEFDEWIKGKKDVKIHGQILAPGSGSQQRISAFIPSDSNSIKTENKSSKRKYRNIKMYVFEDGYASDDSDEKGHGKIKEVYDSKKEYARYLQLRLMEENGKISQLDRQKVLIIQPGFTYQGKRIRAITYAADFVYVQNGVYVVEDVKPKTKVTKRNKNKIEVVEKYRTTEAFNLKWKLLKARYPEYDFRLF